MKLTALLTLIFSMLAVTSSPAQQESPHLVIIMSDDMGWNDVGYHGSPAETPHIDSLARDGIELDRFYVHPICSPTRAALMTGRIPARFGITGPLGSSADKGLPLDENMISQSFQRAGYETAIVGKWHLGDSDPYHPLNRGFDHFYGHLSGMIDYYEHTNRAQRDWQRNGEPLVEEGYSTDLIAAEAARVIENRDSGSPLFLYVPFNAPHGPLQAPESLIEKYSERGIRGELAVRAACLESLDQGIGKILAALESKGMTGNTLVLFFCDNGAKTSRKRTVSDEAGPALRGGKGELFEGGIRVPAVLRWPDQISAGQKSEAFVSVLDLLPTLTAAAGIPHGSQKPLDGANRWPALVDEEETKHSIIIAGQRGAFAVIEDPMKLIRSDGQDTLFNVRSDPTESRDLASEQPETLAHLQSLLEPYSQLSSRGGKGASKGKKGKGKSRK